jgi:hypothetical protein
MTAQLFFPLATWMEIKDGDDAARATFDRHYSRYFYADGRKPKLFVGPGEKTVLVTPCRRALFVWRKFVGRDDQQGVNCSIFRNEGAGLSSRLILEAEEVGRARWGSVRFYTYVDPRKIDSVIPGYCFLLAGWCLVGITKKRRLLIFAKNPGDPVITLRERVRHVRHTNVRLQRNGRSS